MPVTLIGRCAHCAKAFVPPARNPRRKSCSLACSRAVAAVGYTRPLAARFWEKVEIRSLFECWPWKASRQAFGNRPEDLGKGVGQITALVNGRYRPLHANRVAWELTHGPIPEGMKVLHECDNPACCNPAHLFLGTQADNVRDMAAKGRWAINGPRRLPCGEDNNHARLTEPEVREIRLRVENGERSAHLARLFDVDESTVARAAHRRTWKHVA